MRSFTKCSFYLKFILYNSLAFLIAALLRHLSASKTLKGASVRLQDQMQLNISKLCHTKAMYKYKKAGINVKIVCHHISRKPWLTLVVF